MKTLKFPLIVIAVLVAMAGAFAFKLPGIADKKTLTTYHYTSNSSVLVDMKNIGNWVAEDPGCATTGNLPCAIVYNGDITAFENYLSEFTNAADVTAAASERKE